MKTLEVLEAIPVIYPEVEGLSHKAKMLDMGAIWRCIEAHIAWRWSARDVIWTVQGDGDWEPPLLPVLIEGIYKWTGSGWAEFEPALGPVGFLLPGGISKIEAIVGNNKIPPAAVLEAFRRLTEYLAIAAPSPPGASRYSISTEGMLRSFLQHPTYIAGALENSGAADLLRPYRKTCEFLHSDGICI